MFLNDCVPVCLYTQHSKPPKKSKAKVLPTKRGAAAKKEMKPPPTKKPKTSPPAPIAKSDPSAFFSFGNKDDSDSDSEGEVKSNEEVNTPPVAKDNFDLGGGFGEDRKSVV